MNDPYCPMKRFLTPSKCPFASTLWPEPTHPCLTYLKRWAGSLRCTMQAPTNAILLCGMPDARTGERCGHSTGHMHQDPMRGPETTLAGQSCMAHRKPGAENPVTHRECMHAFKQRLNRQKYCGHVSPMRENQGLCALAGAAALPSCLQKPKSCQK